MPGSKNNNSGLLTVVGTTTSTNIGVTVNGSNALSYADATSKCQSSLFTLLPLMPPAQPFSNTLTMPITG
jgi:hypothetical protein